MALLMQILVYLIHTLVTLYLLVVLLRLLLQLSRADFYNPISQFAIKATHPVIGPLRRLLPPLGRLDTASLVFALIVEAVAITLLGTLYGYAPAWHPLNIVLWSLIGLSSLVVKTYFFMLIAVIILSWVAPYSRHPAVLLLLQLCEPIMAPFRRLLPPLGGLDLSPILVFILINVLEMVVRYAASAARLPAALVPGFYG